MLTPFNQNWRTTHKPFSLALANTVNTGVSFSTPSGAIRNSQIWARAGFRGFGPVMTFPGAGMDNVQGFGQLPLNYVRAGFAGVGCGCNCGMGDILNLPPGVSFWSIAGVAVLVFLLMRGKR